jgi:ferredoxin
LMRVTLDTDRCQGHGQCVMAAPSLFEFDDQGFAVLGADELSADLEESAVAAELRCPERAIATS